VFVFVLVFRVCVCVGDETAAARERKIQRR